MERHIHREGTSFCPIPSSGSQGVPTLAPPAPYRQRRPNPLIGCVSLARLPILCTLSKSDRVVITWSPSGYTTVRLDFSDPLSSLCLLITTWQLAKANGVTRNEPKIHVICYITQTILCISTTFSSWNLARKSSQHNGRQLKAKSNCFNYLSIFSLSFIASGRSSGLHPVSSHSAVCMF